MFKNISDNTNTPDYIKVKVVVINLWFTSCAPCIEEMPELNKLVKEYENNDAVLFLALALDEIDDLYYDYFRNTISRPKNFVGKNLVLHLIEDDIHLTVKFISWSQDKRGGFYVQHL